jgi:hypothetical protein
MREEGGARRARRSSFLVLQGISGECGAFRDAWNNWDTNRTNERNDTNVDLPRHGLRDSQMGEVAFVLQQ